MIDELLVSATPFGVRTAAIAGGEVVSFNVESGHAPGLLGNIYMAAEGRRGGAAHFVAIGKEQNAFLEKSGGTNPGSNPLVQVTRAAWRGKAPRVSAEIALAGRYMVYFPQTSGASVARRISDAAERRTGRTAPYPRGGDRRSGRDRLLALATACWRSHAASPETEQKAALPSGVRRKLLRMTRSWPKRRATGSTGRTSAPSTPPWQHPPCSPAAPASPNDTCAISYRQGRGS